MARKFKPKDSTEVEQWAIEHAKHFADGPDSTLVKVAAAYITGYADCLEAMNDEHWLALCKKLRAAP